MRIITFANQKGGVTKSTSAVNVAHGLAEAGHAVLLIDMDPQANSTYAVLGNVEPEKTVYDMLIGDMTLNDVVVPTKRPRMSIVPSDISLAGAEVELISEPGGQTLLRTKLRSADYDYVIIDSPPSLGFLTLNCLSASTEIIIPVAVGVFALKGLTQLERTIEKVRTRLDRPDLRIGGVVCTLHDRTNVARDIVEAIQKRYGDLAFNTIIPKNISVEEAHSRAISVFEWAPKSSGAVAYQQLVQEVIDRG